MLNLRTTFLIHLMARLANDFFIWAPLGRSARAGRLSKCAFVSNRIAVVKVELHSDVCGCMRNAIKKDSKIVTAIGDRDGDIGRL